MISDIQVSKDERSDYTKYAFVHNKFSGILNMSERPDLLISLEKIMLKCFPTLRSSDTLASAFSLFVLQDLEEIIVLNNDESFSGIIRANVLYNEIPPGILDIPPQLRNSGYERAIISNSILEIGRRQIDATLALDKPIRSFQTVAPLSSLLSEINSFYNYYLMPRIIPIFDQSQMVRGVVTYKEILKYLKQDSFLSGKTVEDLCSSQCLREYISVLLPEDTLATAEMIMGYTLTDYTVVFSNDGKFIGYLDKIWISKLLHHSYFEILNVSLQDLARPPDNSLKFVSTNESLLDIIQYLIEDNTKILVEPESITCNSQIRLITPLSIISFFLSSF